MLFWVCQCWLVASSHSLFLYEQLSLVTRENHAFILGSSRSWWSFWRRHLSLLRLLFTELLLLWRFSFLISYWRLLCWSWLFWSLLNLNFNSFLIHYYSRFINLLYLLFPLDFNRFLLAPLDLFYMFISLFDDFWNFILQNWVARLSLCIKATRQGSTLCDLPLRWRNFLSRAHFGITLRSFMLFNKCFRFL